MKKKQKQDIDKLMCMCGNCDHFLSCEVKLEITTGYDIWRKWIPPYDGCVMTEREDKDGDSN